MGLTVGEQHRAVCAGSFASLPLATENGLGEDGPISSL